MHLQLLIAREKRGLCQERRSFLNPFFLFTKSGDDSIEFFNEFSNFGKVNSNPLTVNPIVVECLSGKFQLSSLSRNVCVLAVSDL